MILFGSYSIFYEEDAWNEMRILLYTEHSMVFVSLHKHPTKLKWHVSFWLTNDSYESIFITRSVWLYFQALFYMISLP